MKWFVHLFSKDEGDVDSLVVGGFFSLIAMIGLSVYTAILDHATFSPSNFAAGAATIIVALGGGKTARDHWSSNTMTKVDVTSPGDQK